MAKQTTERRKAANKVRKNNFYSTSFIFLEKYYHEKQTKVSEGDFFGPFKWWNGIENENAFKEWSVCEEFMWNFLFHENFNAGGEREDLLIQPKTLQFVVIWWLRKNMKLLPSHSKTVQIKVFCSKQKLYFRKRWIYFYIAISLNSKKTIKIS